MKVFVQMSILALFVMYGETNDDLDFLPTMSREELLKIVKCITYSQNQDICDGADFCMTKDTPRVRAAYKSCEKELNPSGMSKCDEDSNRYSSFKFPTMVYDCAAKKIVKLNDTEAQQMSEYEQCMRDLYGKCKALPKNQ